MPVFSCPVCKSGLERLSAVYRCRNGHSFDIAAQGYVNLLPSDKSRANAGDNAQMIAARSRFLNSGYYACLKDAVAMCVLKAAGKSGKQPLVIDAGCGEGYYTAGIADCLAAHGIAASVSGIDLSKRGIARASKRYKNVQFAVAGIFNMPYADNSADVIVSIFAPLCDSEFRRILKPSGTLFVVTPGRDHLLGLKRVLYDNPYLNDEDKYCPQGFRFINSQRIKKEITVKGEHIYDLFTMTPYFYNTPAGAAERLKDINELITPIDFIITELERL